MMNAIDEVLKLQPTAVCVRSPSSDSWKVYLAGSWVALSRTCDTSDEAWADALERLKKKSKAAVAIVAGDTSETVAVAPEIIRQHPAALRTSAGPCGPLAGP